MTESRTNQSLGYTTLAKDLTMGKKFVQIFKGDRSRSNSEDLVEPPHRQHLQITAYATDNQRHDITTSLSHMMENVSLHATLQQQAEQIIDAALNELLSEMSPEDDDHIGIQLERILYNNRTRSAIKYQADDILLQVFGDIRQDCTAS